MKVPRWAFEKFPKADRTLTTQMKSVGEAMAIGRTFKEAFLKGMRSLELGRSGLLFEGDDPERGEVDTSLLQHQLISPTDRRMWAIFQALGQGLVSRAASRDDPHRPVVPHAVRGASRVATVCWGRRLARDVDRPDAGAQTRRLRR